MDQKKMSQVFKALSNPNRLELYLQIAKKSESSFESTHGCLVSSIVSSLKIGAPTICHHLKELEYAGLIITEKRGKFLIAKVNRTIVDEVSKMLNGNT